VARGVLQGHVVVEGGGARLPPATTTPGPSFVSGPVDVEATWARTGRIVARVTVASGEPFRFVLSPGSYTLVVAGHGACTGSATVRRHATVTADVVCVVI